MRRAYQAADVKKAQHLLLDLARRLEDAYPSAAERVREGLEETLTVQGLGLSERLQRSLTTTKRRREFDQPHARREAKRQAVGEAAR